MLWAKRWLMVTPIFRPARRTFSAMRHDAARVSAIGFSERTCMSRARAASTTSSWKAGGTTMLQKSASFSAKAR